MYNLGLKQIQDKDAFTIMEKHLYKFKDFVPSRMAFGGLYGCLKTNSGSDYAICFFEEECIRVLSQLSNRIRNI